MDKDMYIYIYIERERERERERGRRIAPRPLHHERRSSLAVRHPASRTLNPIFRCNVP